MRLGALNACETACIPLYPYLFMRLGALNTCETACIPLYTLSNILMHVSTL